MVYGDRRNSQAILAQRHDTCLRRGRAVFQEKTRAAINLPGLISKGRRVTAMRVRHAHGKTTALTRPGSSNHATGCPISSWMPRIDRV